LITSIFQLRVHYSLLHPISSSSHHSSSDRLFAMIWVARLLALTYLLSSTLASPVPATRNFPEDATLSKRAWNAEDLNNEFKGIYWNHLFEDDHECSPEQIDKLVYATRYAMHLTQRPHDDKEWEYTMAWDRYFGDYLHWQKSGTEYHEAAKDIMCQYHSCVSLSHTLTFAIVNLIQVAKYPKQGHVRPTPGKRVHYTCNPRSHGSAKESCDKGKT
jgi:hypothetical protein